MKWKFTPYDQEKWNKSDSRILLVATEPNGNNPCCDKLDMGEWFRTANEENKYHTNKRFYNRCKLILDGIIEVDALKNFRFVDLKATPGGARSIKSEVFDYIRNNKPEVEDYFISENGRPHIVVLLGNDVYEIFSSTLRNSLIEKNPELKWIQMPHPSSPRVANDLLRTACGQINDYLVKINEPANKWFCKGRSSYGWTKA